MATPLELQKIKKPTNWVAIGTAVFLAGVFVAGAYYLFFAPTPGIEILVPTEQKLTEQLSNIQLDTRPVVEVLNSGRLKRFVGPLSPGQYGRTNPFLAF